MTGSAMPSPAWSAKAWSIRRRGAGTFVAAPKIHFNKLMSYSEHMSSRGLSPRSRECWCQKSSTMSRKWRLGLRSTARRPAPWSSD